MEENGQQNAVMSDRKLQCMRFPEDNDSVFLDYIALDHTRINITTKTHIVNFEPKSVEECPVQSISQYDSVKKEYPTPELALQPVAMFRDPFRQGKHKIVFCELQNFDGKPIAFNSRQKCREFMEKVKDEEPWFGFEQEFFFVDDEGVPYDWELQLKNADTDCTFELSIGKAVSVQREMVELHLKACVYAGLKMYGMNREATPSQWEYQLGPLPAVEAGDQLHVSRYILRRLAEMYNIDVTFFHPKCLRDTHCRMALHTNFSTKSMRAEEGIKYIYKALETISKHDQERIMKYYDLEPGNDYKWRLSGITYMPKYDNLVIKVGDKSDSTLRIPVQVVRNGKGYFEERRPSGEADPYDVSRILTAAALFEPNGFLH